MTISSNSDISPLIRFSILLFWTLFLGCNDGEIGTTSTNIELCSKEYKLTFGESIPVNANANRLFQLPDKGILVVESGENTVSLIEGNRARTFIDVGNDHSPWSVWGDSKSIYVSNYSSNSVSEFDLSGKLLKEWTDGFDRPSAIIGNDAFVFVSNVAFDGSVFQKGFISVVDRKSAKTVKRLESSGLNPQFFSWTQYKGVSYLISTNSGSFEFTNDGVKVGSEGSVELWNVDDLDKGPRIANLGIDPEGKTGSPGRALRVGDALFFPSGTEPVLFEYDLSSFSWKHDVGNPIRLRPSLPEALHFSASWEDLILISAFNEDAMYIYDPECEATTDAISLDDNEFLAGPHDIFVSKDGKAKVIMSLANLVKTFTITRIRNE